MQHSRKQLRRSKFGLVSLLALAAFLAAAAPASALAAVKLIVHDIQGVYAPEKSAYSVQAYLSVLDEAGKPVKNLSASNFVLTEDSQKIAIDSLGAANEPMSMVLLLDTSGSMKASMPQAVQAASAFVSRLAAGDRAAVISFNTNIQRVSEFSGDFDAARQNIQGIRAVDGSGTCLYDAAYEAVQMAATEPSGRRAVILLTDGVDETPQGKICSTHTIEDVIGLASGGGARTPLYTVGLGGRADAKTLTRMAEMTGGSFLRSPSAAQLEQLFEGLSDLLKAQYVLAYTSSSAPGPHTVIIEVDAQDAKDLDSRDYVLPPLPSSVRILSPANGQKVEGRLKIEASVSAQGKTIAEVIFRLDGSEAGRDETFPYAIELDALPPGAHRLEVIVMGQDGSEIARGSADFESAAAVEKAAPAATLPPQPSATAVPAQTPAPLPIAALIAGGAAAILLLAAVGGLIVFLLLRRKTGQPVQPPPPAEIPPRIADFAAAPDVLATLTVLQSDDAGMVQQLLNITKTPTLIGRSAQNDLIFAKDSPVSRQHAVIEQKGYQMWLSEACITDDQGIPRRPKYGTFINEIPVGEQPIRLNNSDVIRLGPRVRLEFRLSRRLEGSDDRTLDNIDATLDGSDRTGSATISYSDSTLNEPVNPENTLPDLEQMGRENELRQQDDPYKTRQLHDNGEL